VNGALEQMNWEKKRKDECTLRREAIAANEYAKEKDAR
jgi:hypothetical protein